MKTINKKRPQNPKPKPTTNNKQQTTNTKQQIRKQGKNARVCNCV